MTLQSVLDFLKAKSVYVVVALALVFDVGQALGAWTVDNATWNQINNISIMLGFVSFRAKLSDIFAGIDLGPVGTWLTGNKTYIVGAAGALLTLLPMLGVWTPPPGFVAFLNELFVALGLGALTSAGVTYQKQAKVVFDAHVASGKRPSEALALVFKKAA